MLQNMVVKFFSEKRIIWDDLLDTCIYTCIYTCNTSVHESTSFTTFEVMFGRTAVLLIDVDIDIASPYIKMRTRLNPCCLQTDDLKWQVSNLFMVFPLPLNR